MSSSSVFGSRHTSPAAALLPRSGTTSASSSLISKLSENQVASRPLAPAASDSRQPGRDRQALSQTLAQPLAPLPQTAGQYGEQLQHSMAQPLAQSGELPWGTHHQPRPTTRPKADPCIDWSSYIDDSLEGDEGETTGMPAADTSAYTDPFSMLDKPVHTAGPGRSMQSMHKPVQSPMDATLQPLILSPVNGHAKRSMHQQQQQTCDHRVPAHHQRSWAMQQHWPEQMSTGKSMLPVRQPTGLASSHSTHTASKQPLGSDASTALTGHVTGPSRGSCTKRSQHAGSEGICSMSLTADKENAEHLGRKAPVRKALFGGPLLNGAEGPAAALHSDPARRLVPDAVGRLDAKGHDGGAASTEDQQPAQPVMHSKEPDTVDFSSVFDFL